MDVDTVSRLLERTWKMRIAAVGVWLLLLAACASTETEPLPLPEPSIEPAPDTQTVPTLKTQIGAVEVENMRLFRVDPRSLEPLPGFEPLPMGEWLQGEASDDGRWLATHAISENGSPRLRLVDLGSWEVVFDSGDYLYAPLRVAGDGAIYRLEGFDASVRVRKVIPDPHTPDAVVSLPSGFFSWEQLHLREDGRIALFGITSEEGSGRGPASLIMVDLATAVVTEVTLPEISAGITGDVDIGEEWNPLVQSMPSMVWDDLRNRALIVHADEDTITEVDLADGGVSVHHFGEEASLWDRLLARLVPPAHAKGPTMSDERSAVLGAGGRYVYVASRRGEMTTSPDGDWTTATTPQGIEVIDTTLWRRVDHLDLPVSHLYLSPDGRHLLAWGYIEEMAETTYRHEATGLYLIDATSLDVVGRVEPHTTETWLDDVSFSSDSALAYVTSRDLRHQIDVVDLASGQVIASRRGRDLKMWGEVGVLGGPWSDL